MVGRRVKFPRYQSRNPLVQPDLSHLVIPPLVQELREDGARATRRWTRRRLGSVCDRVWKTKKDSRSTVVDLSMRVEVRRVSERALVGVEIQDHVSLDEEINPDRTSAAGQRTNKRFSSVRLVGRERTLELTSTCARCIPRAGLRLRPPCSRSSDSTRARHRTDRLPGFRESFRTGGTVGRGRR